PVCWTTHPVCRTAPPACSAALSRRCGRRAPHKRAVFGGKRRPMTISVTFGSPPDLLHTERSERDGGRPVVGRGVGVGVAGRGAAGIALSGRRTVPPRAPRGSVDF